MILGLSGKFMVGKDTVADRLIEQHGWEKKTAFASALKSFCGEVFSLKSELLYTQAGKAYKFDNPIVFGHDYLDIIISRMRETHNVAKDNVDYSRLLGRHLSTPRELLQFIGTEVVRFYSSTYWVDIVLLGAKSFSKVIITDVRFENEAEAVLNSDGFLVRVERPLCFRTKEKDLKIIEHPSETALDSWKNWDFILENNINNLHAFYSLIDILAGYINDGNYKKTKKVLSSSTDNIFPR